MKTKICKDCNNEKSIEEFVRSKYILKDGSRSESRNSYCKKCASIRINLTTKNNPEAKRKKLEYINKWRKEEKHKNSISCMKGHIVIQLNYIGIKIKRKDVPIELAKLQLKQIKLKRHVKEKHKNK